MDHGYTDVTVASSSASDSVDVAEEVHNKESAEKAEELIRLHGIASSLNLCVRETLGNGACMFHALAERVNSINNSISHTAQTVRTRSLSWLRNNPLFRLNPSDPTTVITNYMEGRTLEVPCPPYPNPSPKPQPSA